MRPVNRWLAIALVAGIGMASVASCADTPPMASPELSKEAQLFVIQECWNEGFEAAVIYVKGELRLGCVGVVPEGDPRIGF